MVTRLRQSSSGIEDTEEWKRGSGAERAWAGRRQARRRVTRAGRQGLGVGARRREARLFTGCQGPIGRHGQEVGRRRRRWTEWPRLAVSPAGRAQGAGAGSQ